NRLRGDGAQYRITVCQARPGERKLRIFLNGLLKIANTLAHAFRRPFVPAYETLEVGLVRLRGNLETVGKPGLLGGSHLQANFRGDGIGDFILDGKHVAHVAVVSVRPAMGLIAHLNELRVNLHMIAGTQDASLQDIADVQLFPDLADRLVLDHGRSSAGDDAEMIRIEAAELRSH